MKVYVLIGEQYKVEIEGIFDNEQDANKEKQHLQKIYPDKWFHVDEHYVQEHDKEEKVKWWETF